MLSFWVTPTTTKRTVLVSLAEGLKDYPELAAAFTAEEIHRQWNTAEHLAVFGVLPTEKFGPRRTT